MNAQKILIFSSVSYVYHVAMNDFGSNVYWRHTSCSALEWIT